MSESISIRPERATDHDAVHALHIAAFDGDEGLPELVRDLRAVAAPFPTVSLVAATANGPILGHVMLSHAWLDGDQQLIDVLVLSPLAVDPPFQGRGIGTALIKAALQAADGLGAPMVLLEGDHRYYGTRGFEAAEPIGILRPSQRIPGRAFQVARMSNYHADMTGTFVYKDVHWRHGVGLYRNP